MGMAEDVHGGSSHLSDEVVVIRRPENPRDPSVITISCPDKTGLGCDVCRIILFFGLSIVKGDLSTDGKWCYIVFWVVGKAGRETRWGLLKERLQEACPLDLGIYSYCFGEVEKMRREQLFLLKFWSLDRMGLLHDVTQVLCELELTIMRVKVSTAPDGRVVDLFFITDNRELLHTKNRKEEIYDQLFSFLGSSVTKCEIEPASDEIIRRFQASASIPPTVSEGIFDVDLPEHVLKGSTKNLQGLSVTMDNSLSPVHTLMQIQCLDHKGLLYDIMRTLKDYNIQISYGRFNRKNCGNCEIDLFVMQSDGKKIVDPSKQNALCFRLKMELFQPLRVTLVNRGPDMELFVANPVELCGKGRPLVFYDITFALKELNVCIFLILSIMRAMKVGLSGQTFALVTCCDNRGKGTRRRHNKEVRKTKVEEFINEYRQSNNGNFPPITLTLKKVGGSFYNVREIVREIIQENRILGSGDSTSQVLTLESGDDQTSVGTLSLDNVCNLSMVIDGNAGEYGNMEGVYVDSDHDNSYDGVLKSNNVPIGSNETLSVSGSDEIVVPFSNEIQSFQQSNEVSPFSSTNEVLLSNETLLFHKPGDVANSKQVCLNGEYGNMEGVYVDSEHDNSSNGVLKSNNVPIGSNETLSVTGSDEIVVPFSNEIQSLQHPSEVGPFNSTNEVLLSNDTLLFHKPGDVGNSKQVCLNDDSLPPVKEPRDGTVGRDHTDSSQDINLLISSSDLILAASATREIKSDGESSTNFLTSPLDTEANLPQASCSLESPMSEASEMLSSISSGSTGTKEGNIELSHSSTLVDSAKSQIKASINSNEAVKNNFSDCDNRQSSGHIAKQPQVPPPAPFWDALKKIVAGFIKFWTE